MCGKMVCGNWMEHACKCTMPRYLKVTGLNLAQLTKELEAGALRSDNILNILIIFLIFLNCINT